MNEYAIITLDGSGNPSRTTEKATRIEIVGGYLVGLVNQQIVWMFDRLLTVKKLNNTGAKDK